MLKGQDAARAGVLRAAAAEAGVDVHLSMICIDESGWAQHNGRWGDDDDDFEVGEVDDSRRRLDGWRDRYDRVLGLGELPLDDHEIWPAGALEGVEPDEVSFSEATGNEGASFERAYRVAAVVLWPGARRYEVRAAPEAATPLRALALALLDDRLRVPPTPYPDMARPAEVGCACEDCAALARFLLHPVRARWELKAAKYAREHVEARVKRAVLDLDLATVTRGSPHTLVCTKNSASHERRVAQRERDLAWRRALGG